MNILPLFSTQRRRARAFTLIELLVVISIIAILAAIIMPVLGRVKESGNRVSCMSNMRQIGAGTISFSADNDGNLPSVGEASPGSDGSFLSQTAENWITQVLPYVGKSAAVLVCPTTVKEKPTKAGATTYLGNAAVLGRRLASVQRAPRVVMFQEINRKATVSYCRPTYSGDRATKDVTYYYWHYTDPTKNSENYTNAHGDIAASRGGGNVLFADGHAEYRLITSMTSGDYGFTPPTDDIKASNSKQYQFNDDFVNLQ